MIKNKATLLVAAIIALSVAVFASGFQINECGSRAMGMGNAFTGLANDPSALFFNVAGITQLKGTQFSFGSTLIAPSASFTGPSATHPKLESKLKSRYFTPINFYYTQEITPELSVGLGVNNPYGLGTEWEEDWIGRYRTVETEIRTFNFTPSVAYKINDQLSIGAGAIISYADVIITRKIALTTPPLPDANIELKGDNLAYGFLAGILYKPTKELQLGASFRSNVKYSFEGDVKVTLDPSIPEPVSTAIMNAMPKGGIEAPFKTPYNATFGLAFFASPELTITGDFQYNAWSSYDKLEITFKDLPIIPGTNPSVSEREFEDSYIIRAGCEYIMNPTIALRGGLFYDKNPIKDERLDPMLPDADRIGFNVGVGYKIMPNLSVDLAYLFLLFMDREIFTSNEVMPIPGVAISPALNGKYKISAHLIGLNLSYSL